jgi:pyridine nucleotide-disulfide oxidoreductase
MSPNHFETLIVGGGKAGKTLAIDLAKSGRRVERGIFGGSCVNVACIPTKTMVKSAKVAELSRFSKRTELARFCCVLRSASRASTTPKGQKPALMKTRAGDQGGRAFPQCARACPSRTSVCR